MRKNVDCDQIEALDTNSSKYCIQLYTWNVPAHPPSSPNTLEGRRSVLVTIRQAFTLPPMADIKGRKPAVSEDSILKIAKPKPKVLKPEAIGTEVSNAFSINDKGNARITCWSLDWTEQRSETNS